MTASHSLHLGVYVSPVAEQDTNLEYIYCQDVLQIYTLWEDTNLEYIYCQDVLQICTLRKTLTWSTRIAKTTDSCALRKDINLEYMNYQVVHVHALRKDIYLEYMNYQDVLHVPELWEDTYLE